MPNRNSHESECTPLTAGYITVAEAARFLGVCRATLYSLMDAGEIPYAKFGSCRRIAWDDLRAYADRCTVRRE